MALIYKGIFGRKSVHNAAIENVDFYRKLAASKLVDQETCQVLRQVKKTANLSVSTTYTYRDQILPLFSAEKQISVLTLHVLLKDSKGRVHC